jgi:hypothetical protein
VASSMAYSTVLPTCTVDTRFSRYRGGLHRPSHRTQECQLLLA